MTRRIVFMVSAAEMGGVEFSTLYLASHLDPARWDVMVFCPGEGSLSESCRQAGLRVDIHSLPGMISISFRIGKSDRRFPNPIAWFYNSCIVFFGILHFSKALRENKPDMVVTKGLYAHFVGGAAAWLASVRCIWHVQDFISSGPVGIYRRLFGLAARLLPVAIVVDGASIARLLPDEVQERVHIVLNGVDVETFCPNINAGPLRYELGIPPGAMVIGHVARITPWKGQHHLLEAFGRIAPQFQNTCLLLVGSALFDNDTYERRLRLRVKELDLDGRVIFTGFRTDLPRVLNVMDIFAYPSVEKDTSPLALISALACGLPVAAFDIEGTREVLDGAGLLVQTRDEQSLTDVLVQLLNDCDLRQRMAVAGRERAVKRFSLEQYTSAMENILDLS